MRRAWRGLASVALVVAALSMLMSAWLFKLNADRVDQINSERLRNTERSCVVNSEQNRAILAYLDALGATRLELEQAREFFPAPSVQECAVRAREQVTP